MVSFISEGKFLAPYGNKERDSSDKKKRDESYGRDQESNSSQCQTIELKTMNYIVTNLARWVNVSVNDASSHQDHR